MKMPPAADGKMHVYCCQWQEVDENRAPSSNPSLKKFRKGVRGKPFEKGFPLQKTSREEP
jgi:hypothetical protein